MHPRIARRQQRTAPFSDFRGGRPCLDFVIFKHRALLISAMAYPFRVNFLSDVYESTAAAIDEGGLTGTVKQVGFKLNYFQTAC